MYCIVLHIKLVVHIHSPTPGSIPFFSHCYLSYTNGIFVFLWFSDHFELIWIDSTRLSKQKATFCFTVELINQKKFTLGIWKRSTLYVFLNKVWPFVASFLDRCNQRWSRCPWVEIKQSLKVALFLLYRYLPP